MNKTYIELNGRQLDVRLTLGAIEDYCDELNIKKGWDFTIASVKLHYSFQFRNTL